MQWCRDSRGHDVHGRCACMHDRGLAPVRAGLLGKVCRDRLPWALCRDRGPLVVKEMAQSVSR